VLYRRDAQLRLAECHEIRQRVRASTHESAPRHTLRSVRLIVFVEMCIGKQAAPTPLALFLLLSNAEGSDEMASRRSQSHASTEVVSEEVLIMKSLTFIQWYRILRAHHQWTVFRSMQYALWLMR
jgi:hypothetical protein